MKAIAPLFRKSRLTHFLFNGYGALAVGLLLSAGLPATGQTIKGHITDAVSGQPVPFASVAVQGKPTGTQADAEGHYQLTLAQPADSLLVSAVGYGNRTAALTRDKDQVVDLALRPSPALLNEVVIRSGENPAYGILRQVRAHRSRNDFSQLSGYEYEAYSQLSIQISQMAERFRQRPAVKTILRALEQKGAGKAAAVPIFLSETVSHVYARRYPERHKEQILKTNISSAGLTDDSFIALFTGAGFNTLNFYGNTVSLFRKELVSPLAETGRAAYRYFLADTAQIGTHTCFEIDFDPRNKRDLVFAGKIWIDTLTHALVQIDAHVGPEANINFIKEVTLSQTYEQTGDAWLPDVTQLTVVVDEVVKNTFGATVNYLTSARSPLTDNPKPVAFFDTEVTMSEDRAEVSAGYWQEQRRSIPQTTASEQTRALLDTVRNVPLIKTFRNLGQFVLNGGYVPITRGLEAGSLFSLWAYNPVEGHRLRLGLQTNTAFSRTWQLAAYGAYGTRDRVWKSGWEINFVPTRQPLTLVTLKSTYDLEQLGYRTENLADNPFLRITSRFGSYPQAYYQRETALSMQRDWGADFTQTAGIRYRRFNPAFPFAFNSPSDEGQSSHLQSDFWGTEWFLETRYAPGRLPARRVTNRRVQRKSTETAPIVALRYTYGNSSFTGGAFDPYHKWQFQFDHAIRWGLWGRTQYTIQAGYTPSTLPYPLLQVHMGNQTPFYNRNAYNLMNYAEFASDRYVSVALEHKFEGLFTNRLPLIRRWGWRSFVNGKALWGSLSAANQHLIATHDATGRPIPPIHSLGRDPYVEVGYGLENVAKLVRVEAVHRLTYQRNPQVTPFAVKLSFQLGL